jgi:Zn-dependent protease
MAAVAIAGPAMNFFLAWIAALLLWLVDVNASRGFDLLATEFLFYFMLTNLVLGLFNLIPIPPLDGGRIAVGILPLDLARWWARLERVGILVVIALLLLPHLVQGVDPLGNALETVVPWAVNVVLRLAGHDVGAGADVHI